MHENGSKCHLLVSLILTLASRPSGTSVCYEMFYWKKNVNVRQSDVGWRTSPNPTPEWESVKPRPLSSADGGSLSNSCLTHTLCVMNTEIHPHPHPQKCRLSDESFKTSSIFYSSAF